MWLKCKAEYTGIPSCNIISIKLVSYVFKYIFNYTFIVMK